MEGTSMLYWPEESDWTVMVMVRIVDIERAVVVAAVVVSWLDNLDVDSGDTESVMSVGMLVVLLATANSVEDAKQPVPYSEKLRQ